MAVKNIDDILLDLVFDRLTEDIRQAFPHERIPSRDEWKVEWKGSFDECRLYTAEYETPWLQLTADQRKRVTEEGCRSCLE